MKLNLLTSNWIYSPLEQFDDVTWIFYNKIFESCEQIFSFNVYAFESSLFLLNTFGKDYVLFFFLLIKFFDQYIPLRDFSHLFLLTFIYLFTGLFINIWFQNYLVLHSLSIETLTRDFEISKNAIFNTVNSSLFVDNEILLIYSYDWLSTINLSILWDENLISLLIGFFLLGGSEEEEDEDFLLEEEGSDFVEDVVAPLFLSNLGKNIEDNGAFFLKICGIFSFVLTNNLMGMLPYSDTATSSLILTFWVSLSIFISLLTMMLRKQGLNYFFSLFLPAGSPLALLFLLVPIEFISYIFRLVSLPVRLFANMMAGHTLLKVIVGFSWSMILMGDLFLIANFFPIIILFLLTFLELGVAIIQAYIFTILTCIYLKDIFVAH